MGEVHEYQISNARVCVCFLTLHNFNVAHSVFGITVYRAQVKSEPFKGVEC